MNLKDWLTKDRGISKRQEAIRDEGRDPKTGLTITPLELTDKVGLRGGRKSRRRTARMWAPRNPE